MNTVSSNIKAGMAQVGVTNKDMSKACGVSRTTWFRWLSDPSSITLVNLMIIAGRLGVKPYELLKERET